MNAKIVAITQPTINQIHPFEGPMKVDEFVAYVARVSNPSNQNNTENETTWVLYKIRKYSYAKDISSIKISSRQ